MFGCSSGSGGVRAAPGVRVLDSIEPSDIERVTIMRDEPAGTFRVVGSVRGFGETRFEARLDEARASAERALRRHAASVGADAVIIDIDRIARVEGGAISGGLLGSESDNLQRPGGSAYATRPVWRVELRGRAIMKQSPDAPSPTPNPEGSS